MREILFRCSSIGKLMTEPKTKSEGPLSVGAKTHIREVLAQDIFGVQFEISERKLEKGIEVEPESLALLNRVRGLKLVRNAERRKNEWITGEADIFDAAPRIGHDLKSAWSVATMPICVEDIAGSQRALYEWQMRGYMMLWDAEEWHVDYCLVDTPERLIGYEPLTMHVVSHIPEHLRVTSWVIKRDRAAELAIIKKVKHARAYYAQALAEFDASHPDLQQRAAHEPPPWSETTAPAPQTAPAGTAPAELALDPFA